jgi:nucleotide-binding universal stress UspA family protein
MRHTEGEFSIRRILVPLDASRHSLAALETAAELAGRLRAELIGLFVEDIDLVRLTELPFAREVGFFSSTFRQLERQELELQFRAQAGLMRRALGLAAERHNVGWEFRVARGAVTSELLAAETEADLMILGKLGRSLIRGRRVGSTCRVILSQGRGLTLILQHGVRLVVPVMVIYDGSGAAKKGLEAAGRLTEVKDGFLNVLLVSDDPGKAGGLREEVASRLQALHVGADFRVLIDPSVPRLIHEIRTAGSGPVVLPCSERVFYAEGLCALVDEIPNPVLLVR